MRWRSTLAPLAGLAFALVVLALAGAQATPELDNRTTLVQLAGDSAPAPRNSPTPSPSRSPTPSPSPRPSASPSPSTQPDCATGVVCVLRTSSYVSASGTLHVVGEIRNRRDAAVELVEITGNFYSSGGVLLGTAFTFAGLAVIPSGGDSPFDLILLNPPAGITNFNVQVTDFFTTASTEPVAGLSVQLTNSFRQGDTLHLVGTVTNNSGQSWDSIKVIGGLYAGNGSITRTNFTFVAPGRLAPGLKASFDLVFTDPPSFNDERFWVDAGPASAPIALPLQVRNQSSYTTADGTMHLVGEVANLGSSAASFVQLVANYYDASSRLLMTKVASTAVSVLGGSDQAPFDIVLSSPPAGITSFTVTVTDAVIPSSRPATDGLVATLTSAFTSPNGALRLTGTVRNDGTREWRSVRPVVALYNAAGLVLFVGSTAALPSTLAPGQSGTFEMVVFNAPTFTRTRLWVEASP
jgi:hypothetical protein